MEQAELEDLKNGIRSAGSIGAPKNISEKYISWALIALPKIKKTRATKMAIKDMIEKDIEFLCSKFRSHENEIWQRYLLIKSNITKEDAANCQIPNIKYTAQVAGDDVDEYILLTMGCKRTA